MSIENNPNRLEVEKQEGSEMFKVTMQGISFGQSLTLNVARRLAACWNALLFFSTEDIERGIDLVDLVHQRDAAAHAAQSARALLAEVQAENEKFIRETGVEHLPEHPLCARIRAFLEGGAA